MSSYAIRADNLSKYYRIGARQLGRQTFREALTGALAAPFRRRRVNGAAGPDKPAAIWALKDVSFEIKPGQVVGVIGRNGAGKSTLLKILSRITEPTEGYADIDGRVGSLLEVGTGFHPELTGRENVYLNGAILGMKKAEIARKFDDIVSFAEVEQFLDTPVKHYSSGMYVRLAFAVAAHLQPEILLVDEVLAVGDLEFQKKCMGRMEKVVKEGNTVLLVSHNMGTVRSLCTEAIYLSGGRVVDIGPTEPVVGRYLGGARADLAERILTDDDYVSRSPRLRVARIRLVNAATEHFSVFWQEPIDILLDLEVFERVEDMSLGAGVRMIDGTWALCAHHDDDARPRWDLAPGKYAVRFTLENHLKPGLYKLCLGAHAQHYDKNLFHTEAVTVEVLDHAKSGAAPHVYNPGFVNGYATWSSPERVA
jgi:lipopolysaccharide transport system ATP-binding protein